MSLEFEDYPWFPHWLRRYQMEYISWISSACQVHAPVLPVLKNLQQQYSISEWTDCCTGAAGPVQFLLQHHFSTNTLFLTDKYLQPISLVAPNSTVKTVAIDILKDEIPGHGLITMFNALHHFSLEERKDFIAKIGNTNRPFVFVEITHPNMVSFIAITLATTIGQLLFTPFVRPFQLKRLLFTYIIPINIFTITWDGWMSVFRSISTKHFTALQRETSTTNYAVSFVQKGPWWQKVAILTGQPIS